LSREYDPSVRFSAITGALRGHLPTQEREEEAACCQRIEGGKT
jgi:hypothetical protein